MSGVANSVTTVGPWYPPLCDKTCGEGKPKEHLHLYQLHIRLHSLAHNGYQIEVQILTAAINHACLITKSLPDDQNLVTRVLTSSLANCSTGFVTHRATITCDKQANSLIHRSAQRYDSLTTILVETLPKVLLELIKSYFDDLLPTLNKALFEGRYGILKYDEIRPPLPIIKEALK